MILVGSGHWITWSSECLGLMGLQLRCESGRIELSQAQSHLGILQPKCYSLASSAKVWQEGGVSVAYSGNDLRGVGLNLRQRHQKVSGRDVYHTCETSWYGRKVVIV